MTSFSRLFLVVVACACVALSMVGCASAPAGQTIPPEVVARCESEGGRTLISNRRLEQEIEKAGDKVCRGRV